MRGERHPIGLPLRDVAEDDAIVWHYLSLDLDDVAGLPPMPTGRLHLVGPSAEWDWTLFCELRPDGRYRTRSLEVEEEDDSWEPREDDAEGDLGRAELLPFDDHLTYCNGHVLLTPGVVGTVGGPPIGLYPNPVCPSCEGLMFHVLTVDADIRAFGDGFRSLFVCEGCGEMACNGTSHN